MTRSPEEAEEFLKGFSENLADLEELHRKRERLQFELEYAVYSKLLWEAYTGMELKKGDILYVRLERKGRDHGWLKIVRKGDNTHIGFPVRIKESLGGAGTVVDLWGDDRLPDRFEELFLKWPEKDRILRDRNLRLKKEKEHFEEFGKPKFRPKPSLELDYNIAPSSGVPAHDLPSDEGLPEMAYPTCLESPEG